MGGMWEKLWGKDGLPVLMAGSTKYVSDGVTLGHLRIYSDPAKVGFLDKYKISRGFHRGGD